MKSRKICYESGGMFLDAESLDGEMFVDADSLDHESLQRYYETSNEENNNIYANNLVSSCAIHALNSCKYYLPFDISCTSSNNLNVMHLNIRSLRSKLDSFISLISTMGCEFDIMSISESWLSDDIVKDYCVPGYTLVFNNRQNMRGGGVAIYIKNKFKFSNRNDLDVNNKLVISKFVELQIANNKNIIVGCIYRTPSRDTNSYFNYFDHLSDILITEHNKLQIIMGDFNFDLLKLNSEIGVSDFLNHMTSLSLYPIISTPTRITSNTKSLIDNIFTNSLIQCLSGCIHTDLSDHSIVFGSFKFKHNEKAPPVTPLYIRKLTNECFENFKSDLNTELPLLSTNNDPNIMVENFTIMFNKLTEHHFPITLISTKKNS